MKVITLIFFLLSCSSITFDGSSHRPKNNYKFSFLQGTTDETSTVIRLVYPNFLSPTYEVLDSKGKKIKIHKIADFEKKAFEFRVTHIFLENLSPESTYALNIRTKFKHWKDSRTFRTLNSKGDKLKILVASCMSDSYNDVGNIIWPQALGHNPDVMFLTGDNLYADVYSGVYIGNKIPTSPEHLWRRHIDHAMKMHVYRAQKLTPTFTTWDDHDYGVNDGDKSYKYKKQSKKIFQTFFPIKENNFVKLGHGVGNSFNFKGHNFLFLDGRSFRDSAEDKKGYQLGKQQRAWVSKTASSTNDLNWLIMGDQFFGAYHPFESFEGRHPVQFKSFLNELKMTDKKYVFLSGDRHLVEVMKIDAKEFGKQSYEYTVSGMHTKMYAGSLSQSENSRRVGGFDTDPNYAIFELDKKEGKNTVRFKAYTIDEIVIDRSDTI